MSDTPAVAAEIGAMKRAWDRRLAVNLFALVAIMAYFVYPTWGGPEFGPTMVRVLPWAMGVGVLMLAVNRWFVARQAREIRTRSAPPADARR
jgi:hypothetical protein